MNSHIHTVYIPLNLVHFPTSAHVSKHNTYFIYFPESLSVSTQFIPVSFIITFPGVEQNQLADLGLVIFSQPQNFGNLAQKSEGFVCVDTKSQKCKFKMKNKITSTLQDGCDLSQKEAKEETRGEGGAVCVC